MGLRDRSGGLEEQGLENGFSVSGAHGARGRACRRCAGSHRLPRQRATPLGRWGGEIEIAKAVVSLVENDFITGETIRVDGGRHVK